MLVCLDPGHGKSTAGKRSFDSSFFEYEFNRAIASKIAAHLIRHGVKVLITASGDEDVPLTSRCSIANQAKADIFVSIHANAYGTNWNSANGWESYIYKGSTKGLSLAKSIEIESIPFLGLKNRGIKTDALTVTSKTTMPAVLIEHGFYTNLEELKLLKSDNFQKRCSQADARGILKYFGILWQEEASPAADYKLLYQNALSKLEAAELLSLQLQDKLKQIEKILHT
ncbi:N-acetylmuramoyl-L-alanine amidase [Sinanaerobacter chloroacetimidivorans]|uniref:N-acetylmuramoyl-L-alanine amidase n=1 Tax=Sinanaerobacter chloroacetimidivorans TaxID=2818044 RepID=A0A8J8B0N4_9FIRM|nr:N-acetylmuramoyl-L-alanine amidase [Sinanaerobacter chloroacetimidivorans]MBR0596962.1 N-acetylmuramoyl-L-alanine amidase [Sinanaerobacter chloroacetimidivorans]